MMSDQNDTRVYWEGNEVRFIRWTDQGLVFTWDDPRETAINMPRGTVRRLMSKGVLRLEGDMPTWTYENEEETPPVIPPADRRPEREHETMAARREHETMAARREKETMAARREKEPKAPVREHEHEMKAARPHLSDEQKSQRVGILARLIRRLGTEGASG